MRARSVALLAAVALGGCSHALYVTARTTGVAGQTSITTAPGTPSGEISLSLGRKLYSGHWIYVAGPGSVSVASATAFSGVHSATASGIGLGMPTSGHGSIIMSGPGEIYFRCVYEYSQWSSSGVGECQDETGESYDLQITK
jgi:hypothetical protein